MAVREATKSSLKVDYCFRLLKRQPNRDRIYQAQGCNNTLKCFTTAGFLRQCLRLPPDLCRLRNDLTSRAAFSTSSTRDRGSLTVTTATPFAATNVVSHLLAGDLHVNSSRMNNNAHFGWQSQRNGSRMTTKKSSTTHYYDVLGLNPTANQHQIKSAYYKMSKLHHPDVTECTKSHALFTEINEAYETLGNFRKRRLYDRGLFKPGVRPDFTAETTNEDESDYTEAYRNRSVFERGNRPPPPTGRSKIYNFDEFYRQHYGDLRERRWKESIEYMKFKEEMEESRKAKEQELPGSVYGILAVVILMIGFLVYVNEDYDVNRLQKVHKSSSANSNGDT